MAETVAHYTTKLIIRWKPGRDGADIRRQSRALAARISEAPGIVEARVIVSREISKWDATP